MSHQNKWLLPIDNSHQPKNKENKLILYKDEEDRVSLNTRFADEDV